MSEVKNQYLELALKTAGVAYWEWNPKENILIFDKEWFKQIDVLGDDSKIESWMESLHPEDHELVSTKIKEHLLGQSSFYEVIMRLKTKKGDYRHVLAKGKIVEYNDQNEPVKFSGVHIDLTEMISLKQTNFKYQRELERLSTIATLNELSSGLAHEINNPLAIILVNAEVMEKPNLDVNQIKNLENIKKTVNRISKVILSLKEFSSINTFPNEILNTNDLTEEIALKYFYPMQEKNTNFVIQNNLNKSIEILCQKNKIYKVFQNLITNSYEAVENHHEKWIKLIFYQENSYLNILFLDSGSLISEETASKIFLPFFTTKEVGTHQGMGLTIVKGILESHGGFIKYEKVNNQNCFKVCLPIRS